jgi:probable phosphoglycerate mutase
MTKIVLTRHGHVDGIDPPRFRGRTELPLTPLGRKQATAVAAEIAARWRPAAIYTSPMGRCIETGRAIGAACGLGTDTIADLTDLDYGDWHWRLYEEARVDSPDLFQAWMSEPHLVRFPGGESLQDMAARAGNVLRLALERHPREDECVVLVGHDSINRALLVQLLDQPLRAYWRTKQAPCCLNEIDVVGTRISVQLVNESRHLLGLD